MTVGQRDVPIGDRPADGRGSTTRPPARSRGRASKLTSVAVGGALLGLGIRRRSLGGAVAAAAGGWLVYRGLRGWSLLDRTSGTGAARGHDRGRTAAEAGGIESTRSITVGASPADLYDRWRDPETLTRVFDGFAEVAASDEDRQHWVVEGPLGWSASWDTRIVEDRPDELLRWEALDGAAMDSEGWIRFRPAPADRGTEVTLGLRIDPPGGVFGDAVTRRLGIVPDALAMKVLRRFKSLVETGEIPTLERNPSGRGKGDLL